MGLLGDSMVEPYETSFDRFKMLKYQQFCLLQPNI